MEIIYNLVDGKTLSYHVTAHAVRWVSKQNSRGGDTRPRLFINPVPPVGLEPFDSPDSISSDPAMSLDDLERLSPACFYMISWMVLSVAFKTALH